MELMANKFQVIVTAMRKKPYDFLDQRKAEFDVDFDDFKRQIGDLHVISLVQLTIACVIFLTFFTKTFKEFRFLLVDIIDTVC